MIKNACSNSRLDIVCSSIVWLPMGNISYGYKDNNPKPESIDSQQQKQCSN